MTPVPGPENSVVALAHFMEEGLMAASESGEYDNVLEQGTQLVPISVLGRAAMHLTGTADIIAATEDLFTDPDLQTRILNEMQNLKAYMENNEVNGITTAEELAARINQLTRTGTNPSLSIESLKKDEAVTLEYLNGEDISLITIARTSEGKKAGDKAVTILEMSGASVESPEGKLQPHMNIYLGCQREPDTHTSAFQKGSHPAYVMHKHTEGILRKKGYFDGSITEFNKHVLSQIYYGQGAVHPLFA